MSMAPYDTAYQRSVQSEQLRFIYFRISTSKKILVPHLHRILTTLEPQHWDIVIGIIFGCFHHQKVSTRRCPMKVSLFLITL